MDTTASTMPSTLMRAAAVRFSALLAFDLLSEGLKEHRQQRARRFLEENRKPFGNSGSALGELRNDGPTDSACRIQFSQCIKNL